MNENLIKHGFSIWCDFIERDFLNTQFKTLIAEKKILGATSNPSIFASAFKNSPIYRHQIQSLQNKSAKEIYETLAIEDIKTAATLLRGLWEKNKDDGYISIEIDPLYCNDAKASIAEGKRLFQSINEPNVMIKVPATEAGYEVIEELMAQNICINATLIFSPIQAQKCLEAFKKARDRGGVAKSVISVFVSRLDRYIDHSLPQNLQTQLGINNAKMIYNLIENFNDKQTRTLFASTGVKGNSLPANYYINSLLLPHSINTAPLDTIEAYFAHQDTELKDSNIDFDAFIHSLGNIDLQKIYDTLLEEGLQAFKESFTDLLKVLKK
ncbi:transaldolase [Helicobacter cholecystus]|uniref:Transaldolase n=1 Tax=Helicobacter cholecystus TaxID=45498 RepID=A0A3D8IX03_9HELI|nr:transaldolase [Helicobacter cholecystus]RDU69583.1 transaldolase [Helicobacter cholecystus]VEJ24140.1 transaldolase [Helicobacter cholecystus]